MSSVVFCFILLFCWCFVFVCFFLVLCLRFSSFWFLGCFFVCSGSGCFYLFKYYYYVYVTLSAVGLTIKMWVKQCHTPPLRELFIPREKNGDLGGWFIIVLPTSMLHEENNCGESLGLKSKSPPPRI